MSVLTKFLGLFKYEPEKDGVETFNIDRSLNDNWDKIDERIAKLPTIQIGGDEPTGPGMVIWLQDYKQPEPATEELPPLELTADAEGEEVRVQMIDGSEYGIVNAQIGGVPENENNYVIDLMEE